MRSQVLVKVRDRDFLLNKRIGMLIGVISFIALTAAGAYIRIPLPFSPVPITLQTFFVLLAGAMLGRKLGALSQSGYLMVGIFGLPVFTGGLYGIARLMGPTGGYLIGFILAAFVIGQILGRDEEASFVKISGAMLLGSLILFTLGAIQLALVLHIAMPNAIALGVLPFIPGDIVKLFAAATIYQTIQKPARQLFRN
ncbi:MAG: biotin transporter BioY [Candidatus Margulisiibacteriota bacterium]|nr:biotin transporter BioY [Candidatus Margulisiibacteriota bacterium]